jgi:hypothetical protein
VVPRRASLRMAVKKGRRSESGSVVSRRKVEHGTNPPGKKQRRRNTLSPEGGGVLLITDASQRREEERLLYRKKAKEIKLATHRLQFHEGEDLSQFRNWFQLKFGPRVQEISLLQEKGNDLQDFIDGLERYQDQKKVSKYQAFTILSEVREKGDLWDFLDRECPEKDPECDPSLAEFFEEFFGFLRPDSPEDKKGPKGHGKVEWGEGADDAYDGDGRDDGEESFFDIWGQGKNRQGPRSHTNRGDFPGRDQDAALKSLYRQLVRVLHPDAGTENPPGGQWIWHEVQEAYRRGDVESLYELHQKVFRSSSQNRPLEDIDFDFKSIPIGDVMLMRKQLESRLRILQKKLRWARRDPHWDFGKIQEKGGKTLTSLSNRIKRELDDAHQEVSQIVDYLERKLSVWKRAPSPSSARRSASAQSKKNLSPHGIL